MLYAFNFSLLSLNESWIWKTSLPIAQLNFQLDITKLFQCWISKKLPYISENLLGKNNHISLKHFIVTLYPEIILEKELSTLKSLKILVQSFQSLKFQSHLWQYPN